MSPDAIAEAQEILRKRHPRYWSIALMVATNPGMTQKEVGIAVGLSEATSDRQVSRILKDADVSRAVDVLRGSAAKEASVSLNEWMENQKKILSTAMGMYTVKKKLGKGKGAQEVELDIMVDPKEANKAQENIAKACGFFSDKKKNEKRKFHYVQIIGGKDDADDADD